MPPTDADAARHFVDRYAELTRRPGETEAESQARALKDLPSIARLIPPSGHG